MAGLALLATSVAAGAIADELDLIEKLHGPAAEHADQLTFFRLVADRKNDAAFELAFELGDELFATRFNVLDGVGAYIGPGQRFSRTPRADMDGPGQWAHHEPARATGPNAETCAACHNVPTEDGAGLVAGNVHRDPLHTGDVRSFIQRNTPHLFAAGAIQRLAEEMTETLHGLRDRAERRACETGGTVTVELVAKDVSFGSLSVTRSGTNPCATTVDASRVRGVSSDLVVRPFQWKGSFASIRDFNRDACHNEIGMQPVELVGDDYDGDYDGVVNEMTVGDQTALAVYLAAQPRPVTLLELDELGLADPPLTRDQRGQIHSGEKTFARVGCTDCHVPRLEIERPIFSEPSQNENYRDATFPGGQDPLALGVDPAFAVRFDLTEDQPGNRIDGRRGHDIHLGSLRTDRRGRGIVELFGDLKRHDMGPELAESIDEIGTGASVFLTENLWGVASTAPYLHDGRASTLTEAILAHGGEAQTARDAFVALPTEQQRALIAFLDNLVLFKLEESEDGGDGRGHH